MAGAIEPLRSVAKNSPESIGRLDGSLAVAILDSIATASTGCAPTADSADSMTQSVPSRMAFATSVASARVGRRFEVIDSSICVAVITGLARRLASRITRFCTTAIRSIGTSTPRSPRAIMMPSASWTMSSM